MICKYRIPVTYTITGFIEVVARSKQGASRLVQDMENGPSINPVDISHPDTKVTVAYDNIEKLSEVHL